MCTLNNYNLIIGMDSNAHSVLWGDETNSRGEWMEEFILDSNLTIENIGRKPTFIGRQTLALNTESKNWKVTDEVTLSDHSLIRFNLGPMLPHTKER